MDGKFEEKRVSKQERKIEKVYKLEAILEMTTRPARLFSHCWVHGKRLIFRKPWKLFKVWKEDSINSIGDRISRNVWNFGDIEFGRDGCVIWRYESNARSKYSFVCPRGPIIVSEERTIVELIRDKMIGDDVSQNGCRVFEHARKFLDQELSGLGVSPNLTRGIDYVHEILSGHACG